MHCRLLAVDSAGLVHSGQARRRWRGSTKSYAGLASDRGGEGSRHRGAAAGAGLHQAANRGAGQPGGENLPAHSHGAGQPCENLPQVPRRHSIGRRPGGAGHSGCRRLGRHHCRRHQLSPVNDALDLLFAVPACQLLQRRLMLFADISLNSIRRPGTHKCLSRASVCVPGNVTVAAPAPWVSEGVKGEARSSHAADECRVVSGNHCVLLIQDTGEIGRWNVPIRSAACVEETVKRHALR